MAREYPGLEFNLNVDSTGIPVGEWQGVLVPVSTGEGLAELLEDLALDRLVYIEDGSVFHLQQCQGRHGHLPSLDVRLVGREFQVLVRYTGGSELPRCYPLQPSPFVGKPKHMWKDRAACTMLASDCHWIPDKHTVALAVDFFLIWLIKWAVYRQTDKWLGSEHGAGPDYHLKTVARNAPCWCGDGKKYKACHRPDDAAAVAMWRRFEIATPWTNR